MAEELVSTSHAFDILEDKGPEVIIAGSGIFMLAFIIGNFLHIRHISFIPESFVVICMGAVLAYGWLWYHRGMHREFTLETDTVINKKLLSLFFLPIIIFEAGWSLRNKEFISQLPYILIFAVCGTVICMAVVAGLIMLTNDMHYPLSWRTAFTYGALIAAVDPVATLATYAHLNVEPLLNILVMGESIINDAVAIVLFEVLNEKPVGYFTERGLGHSLLDIFLGVCKLLGGSVALGVGLGLVWGLILRLSNMRKNPQMAILFILMSCYFSYHFAEYVFKMSGIITDLFCGMTVSAVARPHLSIEGSILASFLLKQMASLADMSVFLFVGFAAVFSTAKGCQFGLWLMLFCLLGRGLATFPLALVSNGIKSQVGKHLPREKRLMLSWKHMIMMWHAGLRGGIALVLTLSLEEWVNEEDGPETRDILRNATVILICVFLLVFGGTTEICLKAFDIPVGNPPPMFIQKTCVSNMMFSFHKKVLKPALTGSATKDLTMQGSVLKHLMQESRMRDDISRVQARQSHGDGGARFNMFGEADPGHLDHGWEEGGPDDDRWMELYRTASDNEEGEERGDTEGGSGSDSGSSSESESGGGLGLR